MDNTEYEKRLQQAVRTALEISACDDCKVRYLGGQIGVGSKAHLNAVSCKACAIRMAWPIEDVAYERIRALAERPVLKDEFRTVGR